MRMQVLQKQKRKRKSKKTLLTWNGVLVQRSRNIPNNLLLWVAAKLPRLPPKSHPKSISHYSEHLYEICSFSSPKGIVLASSPPSIPPPSCDGCIHLQSTLHISGEPQKQIRNNSKTFAWHRRGSPFKVTHLHLTRKRAQFKNPKGHHTTLECAVWFSGDSN